MLRVLTIASALLSAYAFSDNEKTYQAEIFTPAESYSSETHKVVTKDGYILELHRISNRKPPGPVRPKPVVFLMHGLTAASNSYIYSGPKNAIAYNLANAGFDVWMGNARGNRYSRKHLSLDPDRNKLLFFDFTFEEIALYDLPAMIDYVLEQTKQKKLHYIGHSQGGTVFLILNAMTSEYHEKIASAHLLAGVGYQNNFPNIAIRLLARNTDNIYNVLRLTGNVEISGYGEIRNFVTSDSTANLRSLNDFLDDVSPDLTAGASWKQVAHYGQNIRDRSFRRWNFGPVGNLLHYGRISPPKYDLSNIDIDVTLHYSLNDILLSEKDTLAMAADMPRAKARKVARDSFTHVDYVTSEDAKPLVTDFIIESITKS